MRKILFILYSLGWQMVMAQAPGSVSVYGGGTAVRSISSGGTGADASETLYIGAGTHVIDGTWEIYSKQVVIDAAAVISGGGTVILFNPSDAGGAASTTLFDGNNLTNNIDVNIGLQNGSGITLSNMAFPADLVSAGWVNNALASTVYVGRDMNLAVDGADVFLGTGVTGDLRFDADATISNYRPQRMIITNNSILSHTVKENFSGSFVFPVGIADGDYTPVEVTNSSSNTIRASVQNYSASASPEQTADPGPAGVPSDGMDRTWHIYGDNAGVGAVVNLQHNTVTNQSGFDISNNYVTQWGPVTPNASGDYVVGFGGSPWQTNTGGAGSTGTLLTPAGTLAGSNMRSRSYSSLATASSAEETYFSKSSDPFAPLPIQLISFKAKPMGCDAQVYWQSGDESDLQEYRLQHSTDGVAYETLGIITPPGKDGNYSYTYKDAGAGTHFYRLQMMEKNGAGTYSATEVARLTCTQQFIRAVKVFPNPAGEQLVIDGMDPGKLYRLNLLGDNGRVVLQQLVQQSARVVLDISNLPAASYILQVQVEGQERLQHVKVVKL